MEKEAVIEKKFVLYEGEVHGSADFRGKMDRVKNREVCFIEVEEYGTSDDREKDGR